MPIFVHSFRFPEAGNLIVISKPATVANFQIKFSHSVSCTTLDTFFLKSCSVSEQYTCMLSVAKVLSERTDLKTSKGNVLPYITNHHKREFVYSRCLAHARRI